MIFKHKKPNPFYLSKPWRKIRAVALARDNHLCQNCLKRGRLRAAALVHHIAPLDERPDLGLELDNLLSLCMRCHALSTGGGSAYAYGGQGDQGMRERRRGTHTPALIYGAFWL